MARPRQEQNSAISTLVGFAIIAVLLIGIGQSCSGRRTYEHSLTESTRGVTVSWSEDEMRITNDTTGHSSGFRLPFLVAGVTFGPDGVYVYQEGSTTAQPVWTLVAPPGKW